jgi:hypothetical protein
MATAGDYFYDYVKNQNKDNLIKMLKNYEEGSWQRLMIDKELNNKAMEE